MAFWRRTQDDHSSSTNLPSRSDRPISKEHSAGLFSLLYFQWLFPLLRTGHKDTLQLEDIWSVIPSRTVEARVPYFKDAFRRRKGRPRGLLFALYDTFQRDFWISAVCQMLAGCIEILSPFLLKYIIVEIQQAYSARLRGDEPPSPRRGVGLVVGLFLMQMLQSLCMSHYYYRSMLMGGQARSVLIACIYEKSMKLSNRAKTDGSGDGALGWTDGSINNLMANDTSRIDNASYSFHRCWMAPIQVIIALVLLCINLSYSALVGFALLCLVSPMLAWAIRSLFSRRVKINKLTNERIRLTQETLGSIRFIKMFAWEPKLLSQLSDVRGREIKLIAGLLQIKNAILVSTVVLPIAASMLTFITYYFVNHILDAAPIFSSLALFYVLAVPIETIALALGRVIDADASATRLTAFFEAEERQDDIKRDDGQTAAILVQNASFTWEQTGARSTVDASPTQTDEKQDAMIAEVSTTAATVPTEDTHQAQSNTMQASSELSLASMEFQSDTSCFQLRHIDLAIQRQELLVVIGATGSGKSSLVAALSGEMRKTAGQVSFGSSRALSAQSPWIQNASIKENILFGSTYEASRYNAVLEACALRPDLELLTHGDLTEIGERGVTLSGGQKQRLNIARAVYSNADVVLLDDPLSAVDAHVGRHILDQVICGLLREKCCILVTHQLYVLPRADRIICMRNGSIAKVGTYQELASDPEFTTMVLSSATEQDSTIAKRLLQAQQQDSDTAPQPDAAKIAVAKQTALMQLEEQQKGSVGLSIYHSFVIASGSIWNFPLVIVTLTIAMCAAVATSLWLSWWTSNQFDLSVGSYMGTYVSLGFAQAILTLIYCNILTGFCTVAGKQLVNQAMTRTMGGPQSFFDTTPLGRITNRFSKDVDTIDNQLADNLRFLLYLAGNIIATFALVTAFYHYFAVVFIPLAITFVYATSYYRPAAREVKRHESVLRSAVFARFLEGVIGAATLRAYDAEERFLATITQSLNSMNGAYFLTFAGQRWLSLRLDALGNILVLIAGILTVTTRSDLTPSIAGLVLAYMLNVVQSFQEIVHVYADTQNDMNSVERLSFYAQELEQEENPAKILTQPTADWPQRGEIIFEDVHMRYRSGLPLVLHGLTLHIKAGERIGIVGRTGAGKSSMLGVMLRLCELHSGNVTIDRIDTATVPLRDLRSRISVIPQDPTLFNGSIRSNLDPFDEREDLQLWNALRMVGLLSSEKSAPSNGTEDISLETSVADGGSNFSHGQRQLLALARVLVKDSKIVMCDEATSSVDSETDAKVQRTMLEVFRGKTLLCIAHRLSTVIGYDRILVMDSGTVAEFDTPATLFADGGIFRGMCDRSGISAETISRARGEVLHYQGPDRQAVTGK